MWHTQEISDNIGWINCSVVPQKVSTESIKLSATRFQQQTGVSNSLWTAHAKKLKSINNTSKK